MGKNILRPFVTKKVIGGHMIQIGGPEQTGKNDAKFLTPDKQWTPYVLNAAVF